jgi:hypothetical protein
VENIVFSFFTVLSATLLVISLLAYRRSKNKSMLVLAVVFGVFLIKGAVISVALFIVMDPYWILILFGSFDCVGVLLLYLSTLKA